MRHASITEGNRQLLQELHRRQTNPQKKDFLEQLLAEDKHSALKHYVENRQLWEILKENEEAFLTPFELSPLLSPLLPRFYSIASSQHAVENEVHLTVAQLRYEANGSERVGVCTHYLCELAPLEEPAVPIYVQPHRGFTLPENLEASIIMIGPGTGVAPYRGFMQERAFKNASGRNWLFFGEWNRSTDFFYEEFWNELNQQGKLRIDVAFSRDQEHKVYVQHRMLEQGAELFKWLEEGAFLYVCGDAKRMAKDVEAALLQIIQEHGRMDDAGAKLYLKQLRQQKRYLRDVY
jgi:sulfite reductase (NADPH) flavoprotein alpha-component